MEADARTTRGLIGDAEGRTRAGILFSLIIVPHLVRPNKVIQAGFIPKAIGIPTTFKAVK